MHFLSRYSHDGLETLKAATESQDIPKAVGMPWVPPKRVNGSAPLTPHSLMSMDEEWDFSDVLHSLKKRYREAQAPIEVNFRHLIPFHSGIDRVTHLVHAYPAKLLVNIPLFFLRCGQLGPVGHLRDPFCGSGTVLVEGALSGWKVSGADSNPLARLMTKTKLTYLDVEAISDACTRICRDWRPEENIFSSVVDVDYWFPRTVQEQLGGLTVAIGEESAEELREFLQVCLSSCIRKASLADPRLSVPVRARPGSKQWKRAQTANVIELFKTAVEANARRVHLLPNVHEHLRQRLRISEDARGSDQEAEPEEDVDLIITSPPYVGAQKYIRASSLNIGWLGLAPESKLRPLEERTIGREHYRVSEYADPIFPENGVASQKLETIRRHNPLRAHIAANYLIEMQDAIGEMIRRLRPKGKLVLVVGNNTVVGDKFPTSQYIREIALDLGLELELELVDTIRSRGLMTKRHRTAGLIDQEYIQMFTKA